MAETREWIYTPGVPELRKIIKEQQEEFQAELARERAERELERAERERAERERATQELAEQERAERERSLLLRLAKKLVPDLDDARARSLSSAELHALIDEHT